jgi:AcrR family transcriptional regulator
MPPAAASKPEETAARIVDVADRLCRRIGHTKTAVADIAAELGMSPANIYRFFPSKDAILEAVCRRHLHELEERAWSIARARGPAARRLERLFFDILAYHKENMRAEPRINEIVLLAITRSSDAVRKHRTALQTIAEVLLRDGVAGGEFDHLDPRRTAERLMQSMVTCTHPLLIAQGLQDHRDVDADARATFAFVLRALAPR